MAPKDLEEIINTYVSSNTVMIFSKSSCPFCTKVKNLFEKLNITYFALELDKLENGPEIQDVLELKTGQRTVPNVFVSGVHIGGCDKTMEAHKDGRLKELISPSKMDYDYDLIVIGGGSGGLAAAKEAATLGAKVAVFDFVKPSPVGSTWGLGGTCVNVGCIPKKLMHYAGVLGKAIKDSQSYGWKFPQTEEKKEQQPSWIYPVVKVDHEWDKLREGVQNYIASLNWNYRVALREKKVDYINAYAQFVSPNTIKAIDKKQKEHTYTAEKFLLATGLRPRYPDIPGAKEFGITSDDLFALKYPPGKTLCVGASYVSLECAGFLKQIGFEVDVMVRSILLRGFDQQMANMVGNNLEQMGVRFYREYVPTSIEQVEEGKPGKLKVTFKKLGNEDDTNEVDSEEYNTVLFAIGRDPCTPDLKLDNIGVRVNPKNGKVPVTNEQSNVPYVYALGDIADEKLELTPVAIQAGILLARRLYGGSNLQCDYSNVPTTVFTPVEYSCVGYTEELAIEKFGEENVEVYHLNFAPLDYALPGDMSDCYVKLICLKSEKVKLLRFCWKSRKKVKEKVVGLHLLCPNSGEIMQGYALAVKLGATKADFDGVIGIHPTSAEILTTLSVTKRSGADTTAGGC